MSRLPLLYAFVTCDHTGTVLAKTKKEHSGALGLSTPFPKWLPYYIHIIIKDHYHVSYIIHS